MDAFLRRVVEQREREQGVRADVSLRIAAGTAIDPFALADAARTRQLDVDIAAIPTNCRLCGKRLYEVEESYGASPPTVCSGCGGRKKQKKLELEDARRARARTARDELLRLAGVLVGGDMADESDRCACGKRLRCNSVGGKCFRCRLAAGEVDGHASRAPGGLSSTSTPAKKQFYTLARGLGLDPDAILDRFFKGWIENLRDKVEPGEAAALGGTDPND